MHEACSIYVTHMNESRCIYKYVMSHIWVCLSRKGLPASRFRDKWQTWHSKRKACFSPSRIITCLPLQKSFAPAGSKCDVFLRRMWQKTSQDQTNIFVCESVTFFPEMWRMWRVAFFVTGKSDKCDVTLPNLRHCWLRSLFTQHWRHSTVKSHSSCEETWKIKKTPY